jgi:hypothetical protein
MGPPVHHRADPRPDRCIPVLDHVIIGDGRYYSFKEAGRL